MLDVRCPEHLAKVQEFAKTLPQSAQDSLAECLNRYVDDPKKKVVLYSDRAPYSFGFDVYHVEEGQKDRHWYSGGIIYWGPVPAGEEGPRFSVDTSDKPGPKWQIHT